VVLLLFASYLFHMESLRKLIRETLESTFVSEQAKSFFDVGPNIGLVVSKRTSDQIWLNLFNFKEKKCAGIITLRKFSDRAWGVTTVAADDGNGPLMYEIGMMMAYPAGICVDKVGPTSDAAFSVWKKFADNRNDVRKIQIKPGEPEYTNRYEDENKAYLENLLCFKSPSLWLQKILNRGDYLLDQNEITPEDISNICRDYFRGRYEER
jgi:hypothetical protein